MSANRSKARLSRCRRRIRDIHTVPWRALYANFATEIMSKPAHEPAALTGSFDYARVAGSIILDNQRSLSKMFLQRDVDFAASVRKRIFEGV